MLGRLTGREHLELYARIKGIPEAQLDRVVEDIIQRMDLRQYCDREAGGYSGGNKRKLSVAIALVGAPQIVFLDEPSTGMDPEAPQIESPATSLRPWRVAWLSCWL